MKDKYFLYVGNAYPHKNLDVLLRAFSNMNDVKLVLVGKDDYFYKRLKQTDSVKLLKDKLIFKTNVSDNELVTLYQNALACVLPSLMEGFGLPALEALANNCPVIVSDIPVFHEILGSSAIYFDPRSADDLTKILKRAAIKRPSVNSGIVKHYSWQKMAKETLEIYTSVCVFA
ncbi:MAG: glycosyltransferase family 1 protein [Candidatus Gottesmanbacteria bacterium]|nr:glycosyltransferase family 1 protein [Candidatus Gottesmanbacteria bacterium]